MRTFLALTAACLATAAAPTHAEPATAPPLELIVGIDGPRGRVPADLRPEDLEVLSGDAAIPVLRLEPLAGAGLRGWQRGRERPPLAIPWRLVVYLDPLLTEGVPFVRATRELAARADLLTALGSVEIVVAAPEPSQRLGATRDPKLLAAVLEEVVRAGPEVAELTRIRERYRHGLRANAGADAEAQARFARSLAEEESELIADRLDRLLRWLGEDPQPGPRALLWVTGGFDLAPEPFYSGAARRSDARRAIGAALAGAGGEENVARFAGSLARAGWTAVPVVAVDATKRHGGETTLLEPEAPLRLIAEVTGGRAVATGDVDAALRALGRSWRLALAPDSGDGVGEATIEVRSRRAQLVVRAPHLLPAPGAELAAGPPTSPGPGARPADLRSAGVADPEPVYLLPLSDLLATGRTTFRAQATRPDVAAVAFRLDGRTVTTDREPPFEATVDLPEIPRTATLRAVALDGSGTELGGDTLELNPQRGALGLTIREPHLLPRPGSYTVRLDVRAPVGAGLATVELYWNEERVATLDHPPYEHVVTVPAGAQAGYLRATATLPGGETAEVALPLGESGFTERVDIDLVELPVTVKDGRGRPVTNLERDELVVREDGVEQSIRDVRTASDTPLTVCLTIDLSTSLRADMPLVKEAATRFLSQVLRSRDRGMVVGFAGRPALVRSATRDHEALAQAIAELPSLPNTALYDALMVSLYHLRGTPGRKAIVLLTDGSDNQSHHSSQQAFGLARRTGIPIHVIEIGTAYGHEFSPHRGTMQSLAAATGASFHQVYEARQVDAAYEEIGEELRSQYLVSYESAQGAARAGWREVAVEVTRRGLTARTVAGYFAQ